jgi:UDP-2-acetamido-3-amino-2,3-dideoxy-glucuronate N-acetyltransferase
VSGMTANGRARIVELPEFREDGRGALAVAACGAQVPFKVRRSFMIYDVPIGTNRGGHAHYRCEQFLICAAGAVDLEAEDAAGTASFHLLGPTKGLYVPTLTWLNIRPVAAGTVVLVLASDDYDTADYIRDRADFDALIASDRQ